jgi:hypothetical protein
MSTPVNPPRRTLLTATEARFQVVVKRYVLDIPATMYSCLTARHSIYYLPSFLMAGVL